MSVQIVLKFVYVAVGMQTGGSFQFPTPLSNCKMELFKNCSHGVLHVGNVQKNLFTCSH